MLSCQPAEKPCSRHNVRRRLHHRSRSVRHIRPQRHVTASCCCTATFCYEKLDIPVMGNYFYKPSVNSRYEPASATVGACSATHIREIQTFELLGILTGTYIRVVPGCRARRVHRKHNLLDLLLLLGICLIMQTVCTNSYFTSHCQSHVTLSLLSSKVVARLCTGGLLA